MTYWTGSSNHIDAEANVSGLEGFFPRKNNIVAPGSLVDMTITERKPHLVEQITLLDEMFDDGLVAIANPLMIHDQPIKVVLVVLLSQNKELLFPQIEKLNPVRVQGFHRHL